MSDQPDPATNFRTGNGDTTEDADTTGRRALFSSFAAVGAAAAIGGVAGGVVAKTVASGAFRREQQAFDVALLGHTWRQGTLSNPASEADFHAPFVVEGWIYSSGTIQGDGFIPTEDDSIGRWFCRGWLIIDEVRPEPHVLTAQNFYFGSIRADALFPSDHMSSEGLEGSLTNQFPTRSITGGAGTYMGVSGQVDQKPNGVNTTVFSDGTDDPAPNFSMEFDLFLPNL